MSPMRPWGLHQVRWVRRGLLPIYPTRRHSVHILSSPGRSHHTLAGAGSGDVGELALKGGGGGPARQPFHFRRLRPMRPFDVAVRRRSRTSRHWTILFVGPRITILSASSGKGRCGSDTTGRRWLSPSASPHNILVQRQCCTERPTTAKGDMGIKIWLVVMASWALR